MLMTVLISEGKNRKGKCVKWHSIRYENINTLNYKKTKYITFELRSCTLSPFSPVDSV